MDFAAATSKACDGTPAAEEAAARPQSSPRPEDSAESVGPLGRSVGLLTAVTSSTSRKMSAEFSDCSSGSDAPEAVAPVVRTPKSRATGQRQGSVQKRKGSEWEILGNLEHGVSYSIKPRRYEGFMSKKRKWPLKGWHKR